MENFKPSKSLRKIIKKGNERFKNNIYFHPKKREEIRKSFVEAQAAYLEILEKPSLPNQSYETAQERLWADKFYEQATSMIDLIDNIVPQKLKEIELADCRFWLFRKRHGKFTAIKCKYKKGIPKKRYKTCLLIPFGFPPKGKRTKVQMIRGDYDLEGFELIDTGVFSQKFKSFSKVEQKFTGKLGTIRFELTQRGKVRDDNWLLLK